MLWEDRCTHSTDRADSHPWLYIALSATDHSTMKTKSPIILLTAFTLSARCACNRQCITANKWHAASAKLIKMLETISKLTISSTTFPPLSTDWNLNATMSAARTTKRTKWSTECIKSKKAQAPAFTLSVLTVSLEMTKRSRPEIRWFLSKI